MNNEENNINIRYGETLKLTTTLTSDFANLTSLTFFVGLPGDTVPLISEIATLTNTEAIVEILSFILPLGEYNYQYTAVFSDGTIEKFPNVDCGCVGNDCDLPKIIVHEALDIIEIS